MPQRIDVTVWDGFMNALDKKSSNGGHQNVEGTAQSVILKWILGIIGSVCLLILCSFSLISMDLHDYVLGMNYVSLESLTIALFFAGLILIFISLPWLMVVTYRSIMMEEVKNKAELDLRLCGVGQTGTEKELTDRMVILDRRISFSTYYIPTLTGAILLLVFWGIVILPNGFKGGMDSFNLGEEYWGSRTMMDFSKMFQYIVEKSSPITWSFLGAYYYILLSMIRRWIRADLTSGFLWRMNLRLVISFVIGFLILMASSIISDKNTLENSRVEIYLVAFMAGIIPDAFIGWLISKVKAIANIEGNLSVKDWFTNIFQPSDLQQKIDGLNFWQAERLFEEGIESVRNLAMKEIPDLLVNTRFDTPCLIDWVDQALLCSQVGATLPIDCFRGIGIKTASDLLYIWELEDSQGKVTRRNALVKLLLVARPDVSVGSIKIPEDTFKIAHEKDWQQTVFCLVENLVDGLSQGANVGYIKAYWKNSTPKNRSKILDAIDRQIMQDKIHEPIKSIRFNKIEGSGNNHSYSKRQKKRFFKETGLLRCPASWAKP